MNFQEEAMKNETLLPVGVRRDGSYYTRVLWADVTENDPTFWVNNLINDDLERNGGTWGANSETTANCVLDFFGETQKVKKISVYKNVGITISILEELAKYITVYSSVTDEPLKLRRQGGQNRRCRVDGGLPFRYRNGRGLAEHRAPRSR